MGFEKRKILEAKIKKSVVPKVYKNIAPKYDKWANLAESKARKRCLELANIQNGDSVLEVAVGTGIAFAEILKLNSRGKTEGVDITKEMLIRAEERAGKMGSGNYRLEVGDAYDLNFPDNTFDVLINNYMFDLLPEDDFPNVLGEFKRVLRSGGRLVMVNMSKGEHWYNLVWETFYRIKPAAFGGCRGVYLLPYLEGAGFEELKREFISQITFPSEVVYGIKP